MSKNKVKIIVYVIIFILLGIGGYFYYNYLQQQSAALDQGSQAIIAKTFADKKLDTTVLQDKKFKELKKIVVEDSVIGITPSVASSTAISSVDIANIPRRHSNPFKTF